MANNHEILHVYQILYLPISSENQQLLKLTNQIPQLLF